MGENLSSQLTASGGGKISRDLIGSSPTGRETARLAESAPAAIGTHSFAHQRRRAVDVD